MRRSWEQLPAPVRYLAPRFAALPFIWLAVTLGVFLVLFVITDPTDPFLRASAAPQNREIVKAGLGIDDSAARLYGDWLSDLAHGDLGRSLWGSRTTVRSDVAERFQSSAEILVLSLTFGAALGAAGLQLVERRRSRWADDLFWVVSAVGASVPVFVLGWIVLVIPSDAWGYAAPIGRAAKFYSEPLANVRQFLPPALVVATPVAAFILSARHNSARPSRFWLFIGATMIRALPTAVSGVIVVELIFTIPGVGLLFLRTATTSDLFALRSLAAVAIGGSLTVWLFLPRTAADEHVEPPESSTVFDLRRLEILASLAAVSVFVVLGVFGPYLAPHSPTALIGTPDQPWSATFPLGTNNIGQDELSRILHALRRSSRMTAAVLAFGFLPGLV